jgi:hypothetical protein
MNEIMLVDEEDFPAFLAIKRAANGSTFSDKLHGFLYDFHIYQAAHLATVTTHAATCTGGKCATYEWNEYSSGNTCGA